MALCSIMSPPSPRYDDSTSHCHTMVEQAWGSILLRKIWHKEMHVSGFPESQRPFPASRTNKWNTETEKETQATASTTVCPTEEPQPVKRCPGRQLSDGVDIFRASHAGGDPHSPFALGGRCSVPSTQAVPGALAGAESQLRMRPN